MRLSILAAFGLAACVVSGSETQSHSKLHARSTKTQQEQIPRYFSGTCTEEKMTIRKEWRHLSRTEQTKFLDAVQCLMDKPAKSGLTATTSRFSDLQALHRGMTNTAYADIIHHVVCFLPLSFLNETKKQATQGQFLPWHRYYMHIYEHLLRNECDYAGSIP